MGFGVKAQELDGWVKAFLGVAQLSQMPLTVNHILGTGHRTVLTETLQEMIQALRLEVVTPHSLKDVILTMSNVFIKCCWTGPAMPNKHLLVLMLM
jgi:hypothetical protein